MIWGILLVAEKKKILYMVEAMGGGVFTYIVDGCPWSIIIIKKRTYRAQVSPTRLRSVRNRLKPL